MVYNQDTRTWLAQTNNSVDIYDSLRTSQPIVSISSNSKKYHPKSDFRGNYFCNGDNRTIEIYDIRSIKNPLKVITPSTESIKRIKFSPHSNHIYAMNVKGDLFKYILN